MSETTDYCNFDDLSKLSLNENITYGPFLRAYQHYFKIEEEEKSLECSEYIFKYMIMHGSGILKERYVKRLPNPTNLWFEATYIFSEFVKDGYIVDQLKRLKLPESEQVKLNEFLKEYERSK